ncbi:unnamed protein product [Lactuca virosa]|uniref:Uncharacterized protein n=1 Tax=Lactuca virosa TaxID=75947 RepID=A0AAU9LZ71_9ASTR|nr:unnamed protein product [Lactuca virosa]
MSVSFSSPTLSTAIDFIVFLNSYSLYFFSLPEIRCSYDDFLDFALIFLDSIRALISNKPPLQVDRFHHLYRRPLHSPLRRSLLLGFQPYPSPATPSPPKPPPVSLPPPYRIHRLPIRHLLLLRVYHQGLGATTKGLRRDCISHYRHLHKIYHKIDPKLPRTGILNDSYGWHLLPKPKNASGMAPR